MAKEFKDKKRKALAPEDTIEKVKKVKKATAEVAEAPVKKRKATEDAAPATAKKSKTPKAGAEATVYTAVPTKEVSSTKFSNNANGGPDVEKNDASKAKNAKAGEPAVKASKTKHDQAAELASDAASISDAVSASDSEIDDQTEALLEGFESSGDEEDAHKEGGLKAGQDVPKIPTMTNKSKKQLRRLQDKAEAEKPGVVYIGHIPHGFYEHEMRAYFTQFGNILKLRLSRNKKTGASKHYAWIQFESGTVADIVARTMDSYLLFNHILKVKVVPDEQIPEDLFKGANKRFKKVPWNKIEGRKLAQPASEATWDKRVKKEEQRRQKKAEKLKEIGYEFEAPAIKSAKGVAKKKVAAVIEGGDVDAPKEVDAAPVTEHSEQSSQKKGKKAKKTKTDDGDVEEAKAAPVENAEESAPEKEAQQPKDKKSKKGKQAKPAQEPDSTTPVAAEELFKEKKSKKHKSLEVTDLAVPTTTEVVQPKEKKAKKEKKSKNVEAPVVPNEPEAPMEKQSKKERKRKAEDGDDTAVAAPVEKKKAKKERKEKKTV